MTTSTEKSYFDLHITGLGYLNRIREGVGPQVAQAEADHHFLLRRRV